MKRKARTRKRKKERKKERKNRSLDEKESKN